MIHTHLIIDNINGTIIAAFFNENQAMEYTQFLSATYGEMVPDDPTTYRFVWEEITNYGDTFAHVFRAVESLLSKPYPHY